MAKTRPVTLALTLVVAVGGLTACGGKNRWCEHDATDRRVSNSYCERGAAGYEWESDGGKTKIKKTRKTKSRH